MRIIVVGGGASGVVSAILAKKKDCEVILLEKNDKLLKKLLLTGNGRCNYMHDEYSSSNFHSENLEYYDEFVTPYLIDEVHYFFDSLGIISKNKNGYLYPFTNQASTIRDALLQKLEEEEIPVYYDTCVLNIEKKKDQFYLHTNQRDFYCDQLVLATGGCAYPKTGSDGCGYSFLEQLCHTIVPPVPALVPLISSGSYCKEWDGVRADCVLSLEEDGEVIATEEGEVQFTSYGISGICTFNLSHFVSRGLYQGKKEKILINFVPFVETLITPWMDRYSKKNPHKTLFQLLEGFLNRKLVPILLEESHLKKDARYEELTHEEKMLLCKNLKSFPVPITGTKDFDQCQISNGGVSLQEIDLHTMESKIVKDLFVTGELLDLNGDCGGFNLTICWISGILAGRSLGDRHVTDSTD